MFSGTVASCQKLKEAHHTLSLGLSCNDSRGIQVQDSLIDHGLASASYATFPFQLPRVSWARTRNYPLAIPASRGRKRHAQASLFLK